MSASATIAARETIYGSFEARAAVAQALIAVLSEDTRWPDLEPHERHALIMIMEKASRIVCGSSHRDNWHDIAGYAELVEGV